MDIHTLSINIIFGISGFILGQLAKFIIDPVQDLRKHIFQAKYVLEFHSVTYTFPLYKDTDEYLAKNKTMDQRRKEKYEKAVIELRSAALNLSIAIDNVIFYNTFYLLKILPNRGRLKIAAMRIRHLSNISEIRTKANQDNSTFIEHIKDLESYISWKELVYKKTFKLFSILLP